MLTIVSIRMILVVILMVALFGIACRSSRSIEIPTTCALQTITPARSRGDSDVVKLDDLKVGEKVWVTWLAVGKDRRAMISEAYGFRSEPAGLKYRIRKVDATGFVLVCRGSSDLYISETQDSFAGMEHSRFKYRPIVGVE